MPATINALASVLLLLLPSAVLAQSIITGGISGNVADPSGAVIMGASVSLTNIATAETQTATTNSSGAYVFPLLKPGSYTVRVEQKGFRASTQNVQVPLGQTAAANFKLELGAENTTIEVTTTGELLQTETANIVTTINTRDVEKVPNGGGDLTAIANLAPGVQMNTTAGFGYGNFSAFGLPGTANLFTINGNDYNDPFLNLNNSGSSNLLLGSSEIQEVAVVVNGYTGQYGRQAGAQIDYVTKSGANAFHGDAIYNWTGRALAANDFFLNRSGSPRPFSNNNIWSADFGGPIKKDKLFFFAHNEGIRYIFGTSSHVVLPSPNLETSILGTIPASQLPFYQNIFNLYNGTPGISKAVVAPGSCPGTFTFNGPGGPAETDCTQNFSTSSANGNHEWRLSVRGDYNISDKSRAFARVTIDRGVQPTWTDPINKVFNITSTQPQWDAQLSFTHAFSPQTVNNFVGSILYYSAIFTSPDFQKALATFPYNMAVTDVGFSNLGTGGALGNFFPQGRKSTQWQLVDDLSVTRGTQSFKMGVSWRRNDVSDFSAEAFGFPSVATSLASFAWLERRRQLYVQPFAG